MGMGVGGGGGAAVGVETGAAVGVAVSGADSQEARARSARARIGVRKGSVSGWEWRECNMRHMRQRRRHSTVWRATLSAKNTEECVEREPVYIGYLRDVPGTPADAGDSATSCGSSSIRSSSTAATTSVSPWVSQAKILSRLRKRHSNRMSGGLPPPTLPTLPTSHHTTGPLPPPTSPPQAVAPATRASYLPPDPARCGSASSSPGLSGATSSRFGCLPPGSAERTRLRSSCRAPTPETRPCF